MTEAPRIALAVAGLALAAAGAAWWLAEDSGRSVDTAGQASAAPAAPATPADHEPPPTPSAAPRTPGSPERVVIRALRVDAPVLPVHANDRTLVPPSDPTRLGWWADGARPGDAEGSVLVTGHTVHTGGGALDDLERLRPGDRVDVGTDAGRFRYAVRSTRVYSKGHVADAATRLFSQDVPGRLVLITCEDWDGERYLSNVVVVATPVSP